MLISSAVIIDTVSSHDFDIQANSEVTPKTDAGDSGNSSIVYFNHGNDTTTLQFTYGEQFEYPFTGVEFKLRKPVKTDNYDYVLVKLEKMNLKMITIGIFTEGNPEKKTSTWHEMEKPVQKTTENVLHLPLKSFHTPSWWFTSYGLPLTQSNLEDWGDIRGFQILCKQRLPSETEDTLVIKAIQLKQSRLKTALRILIASVAASASAVLLFSKKIGTAIKTRFGNTKTIPYKKRTIRTDRIEWDENINKYIRANFDTAAFGKCGTCGACDVTAGELERLTLKFAGTTFAAYLKDLRIQKAKNLLDTSNLSIIRISEETGFGSISGFNASFKKTTGLTPGTYRKKNET